MSDIQMIKDQIKGLIGKGKILRSNEAIFLKIQGIKEEIEKTNLEREDTHKKLEKAKTENKKLVDKKNSAVNEATGKISAAMNEILPVGSAVFNLGNGLDIGWKIENKITPYNGLSGAERQIFDTALAHVLNANIIVLEAAELDDNHLQAALEDLGKIDAQVIVNTCHNVDITPKPFVKIELKEMVA